MPEKKKREELFTKERTKEPHIHEWDNEATIWIIKMESPTTKEVVDNQTGLFSRKSTVQRFCILFLFSRERIKNWET